MEADNNAEAAPDGGTNGQSATGETLYALSDEQILEIEPEAGGNVAGGPSTALGTGPSTALGTGQRPAATEVRTAPPNGQAARVAPDNNEGAGEIPRVTQDAALGTTERPRPAQQGADQVAPQPAAGENPPPWLEEMIADPQKGGEARAFWEQTREASTRSQQLEELDRTYFNGDAATRTRLAETLLREDPAAFREMVFAGLKALEATGSPALAGSGRAQAQKHGEGHQESAVAGHESLVAAYAAFERAANEDLDRSVGSEIGRVLEQALPSSSRAESAPVRERLSSAIRQEIETALRGDRNLGDQVAQVLAGRKFDDATRAQVVRLIGERARQLVPGAAKRVLSEWTQTALAAHRARTQKTEAAASRRDVEGVSAVPGNVPKRSTSSREIDYRRLSDEQILEM